MAAVRNVIDKSLAERDANIDKFCTSVDKDIVFLNKEVKELKQRAQVMLKALVVFRNWLEVSKLKLDKCLFSFRKEDKKLGSLTHIFVVII